ncbi:MAG TPA: hypothetical protein VKU90_09290 [Caulobacteraceae bacterium]|nr:hypothetical protein [Caulobacteraceae bacterium]
MERTLAIVAVAAAVAGPAASEALLANYACRLKHQATFFTSVDQLPQAIRADLERREHVALSRPPRAQDAAPASESGVRTIVVETDEPWFRLVKFGKSDRTYFIWFERGGYGGAAYQVFYSLAVSGRTDDPVADWDGGFASESPCRATDDFLDGVRPYQPIPR